MFLDFSKSLPYLDGVKLSSKRSIKCCIVSLLDEIGYSFDPLLRPVPSFLINYQFVDRKFLIQILKSLYYQSLDIPRELVNYCIFTSSGLSLYDKSLTTLPIRICRVELLHSSGKRIEFVPETQLSSLVNTWFSQSKYIGKSILIS